MGQSKTVEIMRRDGYLTMAEAADRVGCSPTTIYRLVRDGHVKGLRVGRFWFVEQAELARHYSDVPAIRKRVDGGASG
jgi:excisionase family DNA binding protein